MDKENVVDIYHSGILQYKMEIQPSKEQNNVICSNLAGPRDCHTKWSKSKTNMLLLIRGLFKKSGTSKPIYKTNSHRCRKQIYGY